MKRYFYVVLFTASFSCACESMPQVGPSRVVQPAVVQQLQAPQESSQPRGSVVSILDGLVRVRVR